MRIIQNVDRHVHKSLRSKIQSSYLGHLDHIGKLCQTGDGDHIMVGFQLVPSEVI